MATVRVFQATDMSTLPVIFNSRNNDQTSDSMSFQFDTTTNSPFLLWLVGSDFQFGPGLFEVLPSGAITTVAVDSDDPDIILDFLVDGLSAAVTDSIAAALTESNILELTR